MAGKPKCQITEKGNENYNLPSPISVSILARRVVKHWLCHSKVEQPDSNTCREQHGEVRGVAVFGFLVVFSQLHVGVLWEVDHNDEHGPDVLCTDIHPSPLLSHPFSPFGKFFTRGYGFGDTPRSQRPYDHGRQNCHNRVQLDFESAQTRFYFSTLLCHLERCRVVSIKIKN